MKTLLFGGLRVKDSRKTQFARCTWKFSNADEIRPQALCSAEKVTCPSQWAEASSSESSKSKSRFYTTIQLKRKPDSSASLDGSPCPVAYPSARPILSQELVCC